MEQQQRKPATAKSPKAELKAPQVANYANGSSRKFPEPCSWAVQWDGAALEESLVLPANSAQTPSFGPNGYQR